MARLDLLVLVAVAVAAPVLAGTPAGELCANEDWFIRTSDPLTATSYSGDKCFKYKLSDGPLYPYQITFPCSDRMQWVLLHNKWFTVDLFNKPESPQQSPMAEVLQVQQACDAALSNPTGGQFTENRGQLLSLNCRASLLNAGMDVSVQLPQCDPWRWARCITFGAGTNSAGDPTCKVINHCNGDVVVPFICTKPDLHILRFRTIDKRAEHTTEVCTSCQHVGYYPQQRCGQDSVPPSALEDFELFDLFDNLLNDEDRQVETGGESDDDEEQDDDDDDLYEIDELEDDGDLSDLQKKKKPRDNNPTNPNYDSKCSQRPTTKYDPLFKQFLQTAQGQKLPCKTPQIKLGNMKMMRSNAALVTTWLEQQQGTDPEQHKRLLKAWDYFSSQIPVLYDSANLIDMKNAKLQQVAETMFTMSQWRWWVEHAQKDLRVASVNEAKAAVAAAKRGKASKLKENRDKKIKRLNNQRDKQKRVFAAQKAKEAQFLEDRHIADGMQDSALRFWTWFVHRFLYHTGEFPAAPCATSSSSETSSLQLDTSLPFDLQCNQRCARGPMMDRVGHMLPPFRVTGRQNCLFNCMESCFP